MKLVTAMITCLLLVLAVPGFASGSDSYSRINTDIANRPVGPTPAHEAPYHTGPTILDADEMETVAGTGAGTDFTCGAMAGAGLAATLSGAGAPIGVPLALGGFLCALFF